MTNPDVSEADVAQDSRPCKGCGSTIYRTVAVAPIKHYCGPECRPRCSVDACERPRHGDAYCSAHLSRWRKYGDPLAPALRGKNSGPCAVEGCERPMRKVGMCSSHYSQSRRGGKPADPKGAKAFKRTWRTEAGGNCLVCGLPVPAGTRKRYCSAGCQQAWVRSNGDRPTTALCDFCGLSFSLGRERTGRLQRIDTKWCPDCGRESPDVQRFRRYGITREQYKAAVAQGCRICLRTDRKLHVDHDHACCPMRGGSAMTCGKCARGLICGPCNRGLGLFFDDPAALERAANYLRRQLDNAP